MDQKKLKVLFVDDEPKILRGLRRSMFEMESVWDLAFVESGQQALDFLEKNVVDVMVTDMRMPEMDGAKLLRIVKDKYPSMIRFVLSGYSDKEMIIETVHTADQFLTKPCEPNVLIGSIQKIVTTFDMIGNPHVRTFVSEVKSVPTLPDIYRQLVTALESGKMQMRDIASVISKDGGITAKILQLVNSAFFGLRHQNYNLEHAVAFLGSETLKAVVLTDGLFHELSQDEVEHFHIKELYRHGIFVGVVARKIIEDMTHSAKMMHEASMAGILHDFGKVILMKNEPVVYQKILETHVREGDTFESLELNVIETTHAEIGGYLLSVWGLPEGIVKAVCQHHAVDQILEEEFSISAAVYLANILVLNSYDKTNPLVENRRIDERIISKYNLNIWLEQWKMLVAKMAENQDSINLI